MKRVVGVTLAVIIVLAVAGIVWLRAGNASGQQHATAATASTAAGGMAAAVTVKVPTATKSYSLTVGSMQRSYLVIAPVQGLPKAAPIIVMLSGIGPATASGKASVAGEMARDDLVQYATSNQAEIVYPEPLYGSWNAIGCCGEAAAKHVDDVAFLKALVAQVDPGHARQIDVVGYSNGARLAFRMACAEPGLFDQYAAVKGEPLPGCELRRPTTVLAIASANDREVPYKPGDRGSVESLPMTTMVANLRAADKCPARRDGAVHSGTMTLTTWSGCADGARIGFAVWAGGIHSFPRPPGSVPAASQVIWSFFTRTEIAPLPK